MGKWSDLKDRIVLITGATGGLGRCLAQALGACKVNVVALARNADELASVQETVEDAGGRCLCVPFDLGRFEQYPDLFKGLSAHIPHLDGLVHAASAFTRCAPMQFVDEKVFRRVLDIDLVAPMLLTKVLFPLLERAESASVVFTTCEMADSPQANWHAYGLAKAGVVHGATMWQREHPKKEIRFNALDPGRMRTSLFRRAFPGILPNKVPPPNDVVDAFLYLLSQRSKSVRGQLLRPSDLDLGGDAP